MLNYKIVTRVHEVAKMAKNHVAAVSLLR